MTSSNPLEDIGFETARNAIAQIAAAAINLNPDVVQITIEKAEQKFRELKLTPDVSDEQLDRIEIDLAALNAVAKFRSVLKEIDERAQARASLRSPGAPAGAPVLN